MKYYILIIMAFTPGEKIDHFLYDEMPFETVEQCQEFGNRYWEPLTNLAVMYYGGKEWANVYCIPENNADNEKIGNILNEKGV
jgi:hypothetical protein